MLKKSSEKKNWTSKKKLEISTKKKGTKSNIWPQVKTLQILEDFHKISKVADSGTNSELASGISESKQDLYTSLKLGITFDSALLW